MYGKFIIIDKAAYSICRVTVLQEFVVCLKMKNWCNFCLIVMIDWQSKHLDLVHVQQ